MSKRKSRLSTRRSVASNAALLADVGKYFKGNTKEFERQVFKVEVLEDHSSAYVELECNHTYTLQREHGGTFWKHDIPGTIVCALCALGIEEPNTYHHKLIVDHKGKTVMARASQLAHLLENGGRVLVVGGLNKAFDAYKDHPRVVIWGGDRDPKKVARALRDHGDQIPDNVRAVIISRYIAHAFSVPVQNACRRKRIPFFVSKNDGEVMDYLEQMLAKEDSVSITTVRSAAAAVLNTPRLVTVPPPSAPPPPAPAAEPPKTMVVKGRTIAGRGVIKALVAELDTDMSRSGIAVAETLLEVAAQRGITTTLASLAQQVTSRRRALGIVSRRQPRVTTRPVGAIPESPVPTPPPPTPPPAPRPAPTPPATPVPVAPMLDASVANILTLFDDTVAGIQLLRETVQKLAAENQELREYKRKVQSLLG